MDEYLKANRDLWNELTPIHAHSDFYDVEGFKKGKSSMIYPDLMLKLPTVPTNELMTWVMLNIRD